MLQEAEAFALYHRALDLQKHDKFEESAKAYHELLKTPLLKEVHICAWAFNLYLALYGYMYLLDSFILGSTIGGWEGWAEAPRADAEILHL